VLLNNKTEKGKLKQKDKMTQNEHQENDSICCPQIPQDYSVVVSSQLSPIALPFISINSSSSGSSTCSASCCETSISSCSSQSSSCSTEEEEESRRRKNNNKRSKKRRMKKKKAKRKKLNEAESVPKKEKSKYVAIDCEMVDVEGEGTALARCSIVNWDGDVIFNTFVRVEERVTDYLTFVSGVRQADIESDDAMSFEDCRAKVLEICDGKVIVGHALKNDFKALHIQHPWFLTRDTTKYEPFLKPSPADPSIRLPSKLKALAESKLGMIIQQYGEEHDSIIDATAAMELYKKVRNKWENAMEWKLRKTNSIIRRKQ